MLSWLRARIDAWVGSGDAPGRVGIRETGGPHGGRQLHPLAVRATLITGTRWSSRG